jgi:ribosomal protein L18
MKIDSIKKAADRRKHHVRKKVFGTPERPRLSVFRSNKHIYAQIIDDVGGATLVSMSTRVCASNYRRAATRKLLKRSVKQSQNRRLVWE